MAHTPKTFDDFPLVTFPTDPISAVASAVVAICHLAEKVIDSQDKGVQAELWKLHLEDLKAWRAFWHLPKGPTT